MVISILTLLRVIMVISLLIFNRQDVCYSTSSSPPPLHEIKGVIFDMDGTLTIPVLQFNEMRLRLGLSPSQDILTTVQSYPPVQQAEAMAIIEEMEEEAIRIMQVCGQ